MQNFAPTSQKNNELITYLQRKDLYTYYLLKDNEDDQPNNDEHCQECEGWRNDP